jgi:hypothetical protein
MSNLYNPHVHSIADSYVRLLTGESYNPRFTTIDESQGKRIADSFLETAKHGQYTRESLVAYAQFKAELRLQYDYAVTVGHLIPEVWSKPGQPYANSREVYDDVLEHNHLYFFQTSEGFGDDSSIDYSNHPLLEKTGILLDGIELCYNDLFRIVHDYFGHAIYGFQFGPKGETNAWQSHIAMFITQGSKLALSNEAQNQTCFYNYGPHLRRDDGTLPKKGDSDYISLADRPYAEQAVLLLDPGVYAGLAEF